MTRKNTDFDNYVIAQMKKTFRFLETKYNCSIDRIENESWGLNIFYKNLTTAVRICLDPTGAGIYVELIRLVNNRIPEEPVYYRKNAKVHSYILRAILDVRAPTLQIDKPSLDDLVFNPGREKVVSSVIKQHANALRAYAQDVLRGDFSIFNELETTYDEKMKIATKNARKRIREFIEGKKLRK